jgi:ribulose-5-phosphate 4-epimerase/fuculose-1-phosphate aldolase
MMKKASSQFPRAARRRSSPSSLSKDVRKLLNTLSIGHRVLEMEGHGDMALGHMSARDPEGRGFWCKRKAAGLGEVISAHDFVLQDMEGNRLWGEGEPHNEWPIHSEILRARPELNSVGHTHAFYASVFSATDEKLLPVTQEGGRFWPGVPHDKSTAELVNTKALGLQLVDALDKAMAVFMKNHGVTFCGETIEHCTLMGVWLERACKAQLLLASTGYKTTTLTDEDMKARLPQTYHSAFIDRSWDFYCRKLRWFDSMSPIGDEGTYRIA